jgi:hypothetical protein
MATSAARPSCKRSSTLTTTVAIMPATADELRGALGPDISGSFSVKGIERSLSCCSTRIFATEALQVSAYTILRWEVAVLGEDEQILQVLRVHIEAIRSVYVRFLLLR